MKEIAPMFRLTVSYVRYALTALSAVAFGTSTPTATLAG
jgi:hypothetical protein